VTSIHLGIMEGKKVISILMRKFFVAYFFAQCKCYCIIYLPFMLFSVGIVKKHKARSKQRKLVPILQ